MFFPSSHRRAQGALSEGSCPNLLSGHPFWGATGSRNPPILGKTLPSYQKSEVSFDHESRNTRWLVLDSKKGVCKRRPEGPFSPVLLNSEAHNKTPPEDLEHIDMLAKFQTRSNQPLREWRRLCGSQGRLKLRATSESQHRHFRDGSNEAKSWGVSCYREAAESEVQLLRDLSVSQGPCCPPTLTTTLSSWNCRLLLSLPTGPQQHPDSRSFPSSKCQ